MKRLILFDLDGTLIDTIRDLGTAVNHALALRGFPLHAISEYPAFVGNGIRNLVKSALPEAHRVDATVDGALNDFRAYYMEHLDVYSRPYAGMPELVDWLLEQGYQVAVASNKFQEGTSYLIRRFFPRIPEALIWGNRPGMPFKPDPAVIQGVLEAAGGIRLEEAVLVGDSANDLNSALRAGVDCINVTWGFRSHEALLAVGAKILVDSVEELREKIVSL